MNDGYFKVFSKKHPVRQQKKLTEVCLTLPVDQVRVGDHPGFQHTPELDVALRR